MARTLGAKDKKPRRRRLKDPKGGLTPAGRKYYLEKTGSHLRPGVMKKYRDMKPIDMRRKGSWATRFYGRKELPPLSDRQGRPTRFALTAAAWGEPVPKTEKQARAIAIKGRFLLRRYQQLKGKNNGTTQRR